MDADCLHSSAVIRILKSLCLCPEVQRLTGDTTLAYRNRKTTGTEGANRMSFKQLGPMECPGKRKRAKRASARGNLDALTGTILKTGVLKKESLKGLGERKEKG